MRAFEARGDGKIKEKDESRDEDGELETLLVDDEEGVDDLQKVGGGAGAWGSNGRGRGTEAVANLLVISAETGRVVVESTISLRSLLPLVAPSATHKIPS